MFNEDDFIDDSSMVVDAAATIDPSKIGLSNNTPVERRPESQDGMDASLTNLVMK